MHSHLALYIPRREYPRPAAREWVNRVSQRFSIADPLNHGSPWLPLTAIDGIIVLGHKDCDAPHGDIPDEICIHVRLRAKDYDRIKDRCLQLLSSFRSSLPELSQSWAGFKSKADPSLNGLTPLQFLLDAGLAPRIVPANKRKATDYIREHKDVSWLYAALSKRVSIIPVEDIQPDLIPPGKLPELVVSKYHALCYEVENEELHIVLPFGTNTAVFTQEVYSRVNARIKMHFAFGDPEALLRFSESSSINRMGAADPVPHPITEESVADDGILQCDASLQDQNVGNLTEARDVLCWAILHGIRANATDIHIDPLDSQTGVIRLRLNGYLKAIGRITIAVQKRVISFAKIRCALNTTETRRPQDGKFRVKTGDYDCDIRLSCIPQMKGDIIEGLAMRILGRMNLPSMKDLGATETQLTQIKWVLKHPYGIFLVTGPTGAGKTTTLNCFLKEVASEQINVMSIEDPVEFSMEWVKQVQVNKDISFDFKDALPVFLRHDPDAMMIGEIRDPGTAEIANQAAQTGHLVFATLHTNSALRSFARLEKLGIDRDVAADSILGVQAQRLVRVLCPACREAFKATDEMRFRAERYVKKLQGNLSDDSECGDTTALIGTIQRWLAEGESFRAIGCPGCNSTGFNRSTAVMEIYLVGNDNEALDMLFDKKPLSLLQKHFDRQGYLDIASQMMRMFCTHETTFNEIEPYLPLH